MGAVGCCVARDRVDFEPSRRPASPELPGTLQRPAPPPPPAALVDLGGTDGVTLAAMMVEDALEGFHAERYPTGSACIELRRQRLNNKWRSGFFEKSVIILNLMTFFESPLWCRNWMNVWTGSPIEQRCPLPDGSSAIPIMSFLPILPPGMGISIECVLMLIVTLSLISEASYLQKAALQGFGTLRYRHQYPELFLTIALLVLVDIFVYACARQQSFRFAPYGRLILCFHWMRVQRVFGPVWPCMQQILLLVVFMFGACILFGWLILMLLDDIRDREEDAKGSIQAVGGAEYGSFLASVGSLTVMMTGANFPDGMLELVDKFRWTTLVFYPFMALTFFLFTELMLAVVYSAYQESLMERLKVFYTQQVQGLRAAFDILADDPISCPLGASAIVQTAINESSVERQVSSDSFQKLVIKIGEAPGARKRLNAEQVPFLFASLDDDRTQGLSKKEFFDVCDILKFQFWTTPNKSLLMRRYGFEFPFLVRLVESGRLTQAIIVVLLSNSAFVVLESYVDITDNSDNYPWLQPLGLFFASVYVVDVVIKLMVQSFHQYWAKRENKFDLVTSLVLFVCGMFSLLPRAALAQTQDGFASEDALRYFNMLRMVRILMLISHVPQCKTMALAIFRLVLVSLDICLLLVLSIAFYAAAGQQLFGGLLTSGNKLLKDTDFVENGFDFMNFNDIMNSVMTLTNMVINAYMPEYVEAMDLVGPFPWAGKLYCFSFFFVGANIIFNIFSAFVIDAFVALRTDEWERVKNNEDDNLAALRSTFAEQGMEMHMRMPSDVMRERVQMAMMDDLEDIINDAEAEAE